MYKDCLRRHTVSQYANRVDTRATTQNNEQGTGALVHEDPHPIENGAARDQLTGKNVSPFHAVHCSHKSRGNHCGTALRPHQRKTAMRPDFNEIVSA